MGSLVEFHCPRCRFASGELALGWGKGGRTKFWGGLAVCPACKKLLVVDLVAARPDSREHRCTGCSGPLTLLEGISQPVGCPHCRTPMTPMARGSWS
jgi:hypothetical protein